MNGGLASGSSRVRFREGSFFFFFHHEMKQMERQRKFLSCQEVIPQIPSPSSFSPGHEFVEPVAAHKGLSIQW
jgi:hypothetical protein